MAIRVGTNGTTIKSVAVAGSTTQVKKVVVGTPVRRISVSGDTIDTQLDVDASAKQHGSLLIYDSDGTKWTASIELENQNINGGNY